MNKSTVILICLVILLFKKGFTSQPPVIIELNELENPGYLVANQDLLIIADNQKVRMYTMKDIQPIKTIGRKGEGPGEFRGEVCSQILSDSIMIGSAGKVSFFDFLGNLIREQKTRMNRINVKKINNKYISDSIDVKKDDLYISYNIYGSDFNREKTFLTGKWLMQRNRKNDLFEIYFFDVYENKIVFAHRQGFKIEILNEKGGNLYTIKMDRPRIPFTDKDMNQIIKDLEVNTKNKRYVQYIKEGCRIPKYFPDIRTCRVADGKIYVLTYLKEGGCSECLIFNMKGRKLKRIFIPLKDTSPLNTPPFTINDGRLYQLVDNFEKDNWQLIINKIE